MVYLVAFNLQNKRHHYDIFLDALQMTNWFNFFDNAWLISTDESAQEITERLERYIKEGDFLLVIRVTDEYYGLLPDEAWDWLQKERSSGKLQ